MESALKLVGLPTHDTPHCLRHTYATLLLVDGASPAYVQEQLGHASIEETCTTCGRWLRKRAPGPVVSSRVSRMGSRDDRGRR